MGKESACNAGDTGDVGLIPGSGRSPGGGPTTPLQVFLPGESHRFWRTIEKPVRLQSHNIKKSWTQLKQLSMYACANIWKPEKVLPIKSTSNELTEFLLYISSDNNLYVTEGNRNTNTPLPTCFWNFCPVGEKKWVYLPQSERQKEIHVCIDFGKKNHSRYLKSV